MQALRRMGNESNHRLVSFFSLALSKKRRACLVGMTDIGVHCIHGWRVTDKRVDEESQQRKVEVSTTAVA